MLLISFLSLSALVAASPFESRAATCSPSTTKFGSRQCRVVCNTDRPGGDYSSIKASDLAACINACGNDSRCVTAQYHRSDGYCYLKKSIGKATSNNDVDTIDCSGLTTTTSTTTSAATTRRSSTTSTTETTTKSTTTTSTASTAGCPSTAPSPFVINGRSCRVLYDFDRPGQDIPSLTKQTGSPEECFTYCASLDQCASASWHFGMGYCYIKSTRYSAVQDCSYDTIDCDPRPTITTTTSRTSSKTTTSRYAGPTTCSAEQRATCGGSKSPCLCRINVEDGSVQCLGGRGCPASASVQNPACASDQDCVGSFGSGYGYSRCYFDDDGFCPGGRVCGENGGPFCYANYGRRSLAEEELASIIKRDDNGDA